MVLNSLIILPYAYFDIQNGSFTELAFTMIFIIALIVLTSLLYIFRNKDSRSKLRGTYLRKYGNFIFIGIFSLIWVMFLLTIKKENLAIIFFLIYPTVILVLLNYQKALIVNIIMFIIYSLIVSFDFQTGLFVIPHPLALRIGSIYLMNLITAYLGKRNSFETLEQMNSLALYDSLTGIANKKHFEFFIENLISTSKEKDSKFAILLLDIDNFKRINDNPGHEAGNKVLIDISGKINRCLQSSDYLFRFGSDEFIAVLPEISDDYSPALMATKILSHEDSNLYLPTLSIGIANYPEDGTTKSELIQKAENAMFKAKKSGKNTFSFFHRDFNNQVKKRLIMEKHLRSAVMNDEFSIVLQPKIDSLNEKIIGAEALVRWDSPQLGSISPTEFINIAEDSDLIHRMSTWIYTKAFKILSDIQKSGYGNFILSVNVSPLQISKKTLINSLNTALYSAEVSPEFIELEITEGILLGSDGNNNETLRYLRQRGFRIAIDDFGTGYSSLSYLQKLNLDSIKIDKSFIKEINEKNAYSITKTIITLAKAMELQTVAEGVETEIQMQILKDLGCDLIQGFYYSKPVTKEKIMNMLKKIKSST